MKNRKNIRSCCKFPKQECHDSWKDETGLCVNCQKPLKYGNQVAKNRVQVIACKDPKRRISKKQLKRDKETIDLFIELLKEAIKGES